MVSYMTGHKPIKSSQGTPPPLLPRKLLSWSQNCCAKQSLQPKSF